MIQQNAAASEEASSTTEELAAQSESMQQMISFFKVEMGGRKHDPGLVKASVKAHPLPKSRTAAPAKKPTNGVSLQLESDLNDSSFEEFSGTRK